MTPRLRARYGAKDNSHGLLEWAGQPGSLAPELLGLTDKPPGYHTPGERWWPSLGCGAIGDCWALWWTVPDDTVSRAGMVRSEVAVWRLDEIGAVTDLRPVLMSLSGLETIAATSPELLGAVAEALVSSESKRPPVIADLDAWTGIIADLWARLWPEARRDFSARVAVSPPQSGESVAPPLLFCVPAQRLPEWSGFSVVHVNSGVKPISRAALWLVGADDSTFNEVLEVCNSISGDLKKLGIVARAADRLDKLRACFELQNALELLRTLAVLAPNPDTATDLKAEALWVLNHSFNTAQPNFVFLLKNLNPISLPIESLPEAALTTWVSNQAPRLLLNEAQQLLTGLGENQAQAWWQQSVRQALSAGFANPDKHWAKSALNWLGLPDCAEILNGIVPATEKVEAGLLAVSAEVALSETALRQLQAQAEVRQWSTLHAWVVMAAFPPQEAFRLQRNFSGPAFAGLRYLVEHLSGSDVIDEVISTPESQLMQLAAQRTAREPQLLQALDVSHTVWRELWAAHIAAGGDCWPPTANREIQGSKLLDTILAGEQETSGLIAPLAKDLADIAFNHSNRAQLWNVLSPDSCAALLPLVADVLIGKCNAGLAIANLEPQLAGEVLNRLRATHLSIKVFVVLLSANVSLNEQDLILCLSSSTRIDWQPIIIATIGKTVSDRRWKKAAEKIYSLSESIPELLPAVNACQKLLTMWQRFMLSIKTGNNSHVPNITESLVQRVAELGADLAPDELGDIWERAGGKRKDLKAGSSSLASQWQEAAKLAQQGKLKGGLHALASELKEARPHNADLRELVEIISGAYHLK
ncbi:effector-associated domain EAD1-containing protein [Methylobacter tundripaludum]|uniref:Effector-associated domain-containing protein n=1 Tax=Methylobacter tundripaludum (strain ATCC BAA-1195 / DSM 17260 / SV96) TaxID=697282 RepID=G3IT30_METTV|nr:effector-associated domain EAD1-containing protein [Methylobacter tundripaludum]EGW21314.1 hypothetical protein Mettu_0072 [Methylobacter tundripaludum SV96]